MVEIVEKYYCDRCGVKLEDRPISFVKGKKIGTYRIQSLGNEWYSKDLCSSCKEAFEQWWMEGKHGED